MSCAAYEFFDAFQTRYRIARSPDGPWLAPERDTVDGRAFYAAKSVGYNDRRFFIGWIATREGQRDDGAWQWAGDMAVLEAFQEADGTLAFSLPAEEVDAFQVEYPVVLAPIDGADTQVGHGADDRHATWLGGRLPETCLITATLRIAPGTHGCGLLLRASDDADAAYAIRLEPLRNRVVLDRWPRQRIGEAQWEISGDRPFALELERPCPLPAGEHTLQVLLDGRLCRVIVDHRVALSGRVHEWPTGRLGLFVSDGKIDLDDLSVRLGPPAQS